MRVLFICAGNSDFAISPFVKSQAKSLEALGVIVQFYPLVGKGLKGYFNNIAKLRKHLKSDKYDLLHAHYGLSGLIAILTFSGKPLVISFLGSDLNGIYSSSGRLKPITYFVRIASFIVQAFSAVIIVKSNNLEKHIFFKKKLYIVPNGVNLTAFKESKNTRGKNNKPVVLFLGNTQDYGKNYKLLQVALEKYFSDDEYELITPFPVTQNEVTRLLNKSDVLILTSLNEGSPNVIKEAMACKCPAVSTDVGDVKWLFEGVKGYYITTFDPKDLAEKIRMAIDFSKQNKFTEGRAKLLQLGLDDVTISNKILAIYMKALEE